MTTGLSLEISREAEIARTYLHDVAKPDLRARADSAESDGLDLTILHEHLARAGIAPAALLRSGVPDDHLLLVAVEELAYGDAGIAWAAVPALQIATVLAACGTVEQRQSAAQAFDAVSTSTASVLLYEDFGRQPSEYASRVVRGQTGTTVHGRKSSVAYPGGADVSLLVAVEEGELAAFSLLGPRVEIVPDRDDSEFGKLAITAVPSGAVTLNAVAVRDAERVTGGVALHRSIGQARLLLAACLIGLARASVEFCAAYAVERTTWGKTLSTYQGVSFPLVEHTTELDEVRFLLWDSAARVEELEDVAEIERRVTRTVNRASSLALRATRDGVQLVGVRAISRDLPAERWYRSAGVLGVVDFDILQTPFGLN